MFVYLWSEVIYFFFWEDILLLGWLFFIQQNKLWHFYWVLGALFLWRPHSWASGIVWRHWTSAPSWLTHGFQGKDAEEALVVVAQILVGGQGANLCPLTVTEATMSPRDLECLQKHLPELPSFVNIFLGNRGQGRPSLSYLQNAWINVFSGFTEHRSSLRSERLRCCADEDGRPE